LVFIFIITFICAIFNKALNSIWINYFWSSDKGNGPEAIQQTVLYAAVAAILIPAVHRFVKRELEKIHNKLDSAHMKMDHIIFHSKDIPELPSKNDHLSEPRS
jgi:uncharacterized membrane protein